MPDILVFVEHRDGELEEVSCELLGEAHRINRSNDGSVMAVVFGRGVSTLAAQLTAHGAEKVFAADDVQLEHYDPLVWLETVSDLCQQHAPALILLPATTTGEDLAARLAARHEWPLYSRSTKIKFQRNGIQIVRPVYAGKLQETISGINEPTCLVTITPGVIGVRPVESSADVTLIPIDVVLPAERRVEVTGFVRADPRNLELNEADIIVAAGRGLGQAENVALVEELAELLGAAVAATRVAVDLGWFSKKSQVGQTGTTVKPKLYIACGISGATQHTIGMKEAATIVAINTDSAAPIFNLADLSLNCDALQLLPALIDQYRKKDKVADDHS